MADRILAGNARRPELRVVATAPLESEAKPERVVVNGFEQVEDDGERPF